MSEAAALYRRSVPHIQEMFGHARLGKAVDPSGCDALVDEISDSVLQDPGALINVVRLKRRDAYTYMHSVAVCALMLALGRQLGLQGDELRSAGLAGLLHDLGKALVPLDVLNKPGKLTDAEFILMKAHPALGHELLVEGANTSAAVMDVCLHHHEKIDGSGYPHGLQADQISLLAKMGAVCDVYDAVTSVRAYRDGWDPGEAMRRMAQWTGHFDATVFGAFVKTLGIYPVGSLVRLQSGRLAVVTALNSHALLAPIVTVFFSTRSNVHIPPESVDLSQNRCRDKVIGCESPQAWHFKDLDRLWGAPALTRPGG